MENRTVSADDVAKTKYLGAQVGQEYYTRVKVALAGRNETMKEAIVMALADRLGIEPELALKELEKVEKEV